MASTSSALADLQLLFAILTIGVLLVVTIVCARRASLDSRAWVQRRWRIAAGLTALFIAENLLTLWLGWISTEPTTAQAVLQEATGLLLACLMIPAIRLAMLAIDEATILRERNKEIASALQAFQSGLEELVAARTRALRSEIQQRRKTQEELRQAQDRDARELRLAAELQQGMLGSRPVVDFADVALHFTPASAVSGDTYCFNADAQRLRVVLADAMGHGMAAALLTQVVQTSVQRWPLDAGGGEIFADLNQLIGRGDQMAYATGVCAVLEADGLLRVTSAGAPSVLLWRAADGRIESLDGSGSALGMFDDALVSYSEQSLRLAPGDRAYIYTDGISECVVEEGQLLGEGGLRTLIAAAVDQGAQAALQTLLDSVEARRSEDYRDDVCVCVLEYRPR